MSNVLRWSWLVVMWMMLWRHSSVANLVGGAVVATLVPILFQRVGRHQVHVRPLRAVQFVAYFLVKLVQSTIIVAWEVMTPQNDLGRGILAVRLRTDSDGLTTLVANAISLTPGTLTLEVADDPRRLYVHVLHLHDRDAVLRTIRRMETLAIRAFGTPANVAALDDRHLDGERGDTTEASR